MAVASQWTSCTCLLLLSFILLCALSKAVFYKSRMGYDIPSAFPSPFFCSTNCLTGLMIDGQNWLVINIFIDIKKGNLMENCPCFTLLQMWMLPWLTQAIVSPVGNFLEVPGKKKMRSKNCWTSTSCKNMSKSQFMLRNTNLLDARPCINWLSLSLFNNNFKSLHTCFDVNWIEIYILKTSCQWRQFRLNSSFLSSLRLNLLYWRVLAIVH